MNESRSSLDRGLGRVEARVADLAGQIASFRTELLRLSQIVESSTASYHERLSALEAFRRWAIGLCTGVLLSGVAALLTRIFHV